MQLFKFVRDRLQGKIIYATVGLSRNHSLFVETIFVHRGYFTSNSNP